MRRTRFTPAVPARISARHRLVVAQYCRRLMTALRRVCLRFTRRINFDLPPLFAERNFCPCIRDERKERTKLYIDAHAAQCFIVTANNLLIKSAFFMSYSLLKSAVTHRRMFLSQLFRKLTFFAVILVPGQKTCFFPLKNK